MKYKEDKMMILMLLAILIFQIYKKEVRYQHKKLEIILIFKKIKKG